MEFYLLGPVTNSKSTHNATSSGRSSASPLRPEALLWPNAAVPAPANPTTAGDAPQDMRKTVTILFTDIVDFSRLSLTLDPEALQNLLARYFGEMSAVIRRHGGIVERYMGDEIMAVFGVPVLHEDDALRAVRAAVEMRDTLATLNHELEAGWGIQLAHRIGVNTGEVITGDNTAGIPVCHWRGRSRCQASRGGGRGERDPDRRADP